MLRGFPGQPLGISGTPEDVGSLAAHCPCPLHDHPELSISHPHISGEEPEAPRSRRLQSLKVAEAGFEPRCRAHWVISFPSTGTAGQPFSPGLFLVGYPARERALMESLRCFGPCPHLSTVLGPSYCPQPLIWL